MTSQSLHWLSLSKLPLFTTLVDGMLQDTKAMYPLFLQAKDKPWIMDDATIDRTIRLYTERLEMLPTHTEQITRWRKARLTTGQAQELDRLEKATVETQALVQKILDMAAAMQAYTIDKMLAKEPGELALEVLSGKLGVPQQPGQSSHQAKGENPTQKHQQLAKMIDDFVKTIEREGGGDTELLAAGFPEQTTIFKELLDTTTHEQMEALCELYPGFYRFAKLLENLARGIQQGTIKVPKVN
jgi:alanyl-tRNA synthetase